MRKISGTEISKKIEVQLKKEVENLNKSSITPCLGVILVGDDPASAVYVGRKKNMCEKLGIQSISVVLPADVAPDRVYEEIEKMNQNSAVHGILCQLPLPSQVAENRVIEMIEPTKDVDCFHPINMGYLAAGRPRFMPCTPFGVLQILRYEDIDITGKEVVVLGRSNIVGRPLSILLSLKGWDATVTICHSRTKNLEAICAGADILVAAIGKPDFVKASFIKPGAVVIDVGINKVKADNEKGFRLTGDVDYDDISKKAYAATPVPGGAGPLTIMMLMYNTINAARIQNNMELFQL